ncbi:MULTISPECIES: DUF1579 domain-containing protein [unclassified Undibacterium]|uniref:DUF1579 domain-containing protein n=1 Tax=unclassified Undibacterium TaxID=2630295 RepID=UPI002AC90FA8|nr:MULTISPECIES: DUF1579 domain-containing protein [unclassified Undibacterium]MEB0140137.1 DUF1579 domain-containing protein [Undibacterium sp. CCC2.1]WPX42845.1 DUF1579 domain-containing protein [Undibacterium sp. CCC3.4]
MNELDSKTPGDFDFVIGDWVVKHRRLKERLKGSEEWVEFDGVSSTRKILGGLGNLEDNHLHFPEGSFRAVALRSYNVDTKKWSIWWLDGRFPDSLDVPVVGDFSDGVGVFYASDVLDGVPIKVRFQWNSLASNGPRWEQAFSNDDGVTWETNWTMDFSPKS